MITLAAAFIFGAATLWSQKCRREATVYVVAALVLVCLVSCGVQ